MPSRKRSRRLLGVPHRKRRSNRPALEKLETRLVLSASQVFIAVQPPPSVVTGATFGLIAEATDGSDNIDSSYIGTATLTLAAGPKGASLAPLSVPVISGVAVFSGLSLSRPLGSYTFSVGMTGLTSANTDSAALMTPRSGTTYYYPLPTDNQLSADVAAADANGSTSNVITLSPSTIPYAVTSGQMLIDNNLYPRTKALTILGQGETNSVITAEQMSRVFEVVGSPSSLLVTMQGLTIKAGRASDSGGLDSGNVALGGGLLIDGGTVALSDVAVLSNSAAGATGSGGRGGTLGQPTGGAGAAGGAAAGGGIYLAAGNLTLTNDLIQSNKAQAGGGGRGGGGAFPRCGPRRRRRPRGRRRGRRTLHRPSRDGAAQHERRVPVQRRDRRLWRGRRGGWGWWPDRPHGRGRGRHRRARRRRCWRRDIRRLQQRAGRSPGHDHGQQGCGGAGATAAPARAGAGGRVRPERRNGPGRRARRRRRPRWKWRRRRRGRLRQGRWPLCGRWRRGSLSTRVRSSTIMRRPAASAVSAATPALAAAAGRWRLAAPE